jgi:DNA-binding SARP family transcriptional activator
MIVVRTLGTAHIEAGDSHVTPQSLRKFALLLHLTAERGRRVSRGTLQELLYPDFPAMKGSHALRELVYQLRQSGVDVDTDKQGVQLAAEAVRSDYSEVIERERPDEAQLRAVEGGFLPGYAPSHSEAYTEWFEGWKGKVTFELVRALAKELQRARSVMNSSRMERAARACLALDPMHEEATLALAESMALTGAKAKAVELLDSYIADVGSGTNLQIPATVLRRRISERTPETYPGSPAAPFVGRDKIMRRLGETLSEMKNSNSSCIVLHGEAGVGKSRIISEFCALAEMSGVPSVHFAADPPDTHKPMIAFLDLVPKLLQLPGALGCAPKSMHALRSLTSHSDLSPNESLDPKLIAERIGAAIDDLLDAVCSEQPLVLVLEDCHWLDAASSHLFVSLCSGRRHRRLLGLASTRSTVSAQFAGSEASQVCRIAVRRLEINAATTLADAMLREAGCVDADICDWISSASMGNPLFLTSIVRHYATSRKRFDVPPDIEQLITSRIDELSDDGMLVLLALTVLGKHATVRRVLSVLDMPLHTILDIGRRLEDEGLLALTNDVVRLAHPLIGEVVGRRASGFAVAATHHKVAELLAREAGDSAALLWDCAEHWVAAGENERARGAFVACAQHAVAIGRSREAAQTWLRASELRLSPEDRESLKRAAALAAQVGLEHDLVLEILSRMDARTRVHDELEIAEWTARAVTFQLVDGIEQRALECMAAIDASTEHRASTALWLLKYADSHGRRDLAKQAVACIRELEPRGLPALVAAEFDMVFECAFGSAIRCITAAKRLLAIVERLSVGQRPHFQMNAGYALWQSGDFDAATDAFSRAYENAHRVGSSRTCLRTALHLWQMNLDLGRDDDAAHWRGFADDCARSHPELVETFDVVTSDIYVALSLRDASTAQRLMAAALERRWYVGEELRERWWYAFSLRLKQLIRRRPLQDNDLDAIVNDKKGRDTFVGLRDFEIAVAVFDFVARGDAQQGAALGNEYVALTRRSNGPLARILRDALKEATDDGGAIEHRRLRRIKTPARSAIIRPA